MARPLVQVFSQDGSGDPASVRLPGVFTAPIRPDVVAFVHKGVAKNKRQAYAVNTMAGMQVSAGSWGTGRAVARIPRVNASGTHRAGQGAFGNMCRGGRMFAPTKTWRKWHKKVNQKQRRYAICSALAASGIVPLVMARGHRVESVPEIPLVIGNSIESVTKTSAAEAVLKTHGAFADVARCQDSYQIRSGKGKMRNRRHVQRRGPLVVYANDNGIERAFRNIRGVELCHVDRLNLLSLAPGGHMGRFIVWTQAAFESLDALYGSQFKLATKKKGWRVPRAVMANADVSRIINSDEVQSATRAPIRTQKFRPRKKNPLRNLNALVKLNPHAKVTRRAEAVAHERRKADKAALVEAHRKGQTKTSDPAALAAAKKQKQFGKAFYKAMTAQPDGGVNTGN